MRNLMLVAAVAVVAGAASATGVTAQSYVQSDLLAGWTVTLNGQSVDSLIAAGMKVSVVKDATGIWLDMRKPGVTFIIR